MKLTFDFVGYLLIIVCFGLIATLAANYFDGQTGCDTHVSFRAFRTFYSRFPDKWRLRYNYVEFITDYSYGTYLSVYFKNPLDLVRYHLYYTSIMRQKSHNREDENYIKLVDAFEKLNEWEKKHG